MDDFRCKLRRKQHLDQGDIRLVNGMGKRFARAQEERRLTEDQVKLVHVLVEAEETGRDKGE